MAGPHGWRWLATTLTGLVLPLVACATQQQGAIGDLPLEGGGVIRDCEIGYRTFGRLNAARSNAVLLLPWFQGTSADLARHVGPGRLIDSSRFFVVAVDGLGNGVSTSPSNSRRQPGRAFPPYSLRDTVDAQYRLVTSVLGLAHVHAVVGTSMGGAQVFQWLTVYPTFMDTGVSIAGTPAMSEGDRRAWQRRALEATTRSRMSRARAALLDGHPIDALAVLRGEPEDYRYQAEALASSRVWTEHQGGLAEAAARVTARVMVAVVDRDPVLDPESSRRFAALVGAQVLELDGRCGHDAPACEKRTLWPAVDAFLGRDDTSRADRVR